MEPDKTRQTPAARPDANLASLDEDARRNTRLLARDSTIRLFLIVTGTLFLSEFIVMVVFFKQRLQANMLELLVDPALMVIISFPVLYLFFLLPMRRSLLEKIQAEKDLARMNQDLEGLVEERTFELEKANRALQVEIQEHLKLQDELEIRVEDRTRDLKREIEERRRVEAELEVSNLALTSSSASERAQRLLAERLADAALALNEAAATDQVLERILDHAQNVLASPAIALIAVDDGRLSLLRWRGFDQLGTPDETLHKQIGMDDYYHRFQQVTEHGTVFVQDVNSLSTWKAMQGLEWVRSYAIAPLRVERQTTGYLLLASNTPGQFDPSAKQIFNAFAANAAIAIQNARLIENLTSLLETERQMRAELTQAEKLAAMGRTIASVAHELNNPIQTIRNCVYLIKMSLDERTIDADQRESLEILSNETQRISNLVSQLREVFRSNAALPIAPVDLGALIRSVSASLKDQMDRSGITGQVEIPSTACIVPGAADQLRQVFINLIQNAIDAMHSGGQLTIRLFTDDNEGLAGVAVGDTGGGIALENLDKIFEPFYSTKPKGMGLGLPIVYKIIQQHNGRISVDSQPGVGCTFTVWLPIH